MNYGDTSCRLIMDIFIAEQPEDKGIMIQSAQQFPLAYVDTRMAVKWSANPPRLKRHIKIYNEIPKHPGVADQFYIRVEPTNTEGHYDVIPVTNGQKSKKTWYNVRFTDNSCNVVDDYGRLIATMEIRRKEDEGVTAKMSKKVRPGHAIYVLEVSCDTDASLIMAVLLGIFK